MRSSSPSRIRDAVLTAFALLTAAFCATIIYLGSKDIEASRLRSEIERAFMAGLLDCSGKLTDVERRFAPFAAGRGDLEKVEAATTELGQSADALIAAARRREDAASAEHCVELAGRARALRSIAAAMAYLSTHEGLPEEWRIDFVAVECDPQGKVRRIEVIENAIEGE